MDRKKRNLVLGLVLIIVGVFGVGVNLFQGGDWEDWTVLGAIAAALLAIYWVGRKLGFLIAGAIVAAVATFVFLTDGLGWRWGSEGGLFFLLLALAFWAIYFVGTRPNPWPLYPAAGTGIFGAVLWAVEGSPAGQYLPPIAFILLGIWMVYRGIRGRKTGGGQG